jgi:hypothetical protein
VHAQLAVDTAAELELGYWRTVFDEQLITWQPEMKT